MTTAPDEVLFPTTATPLDTMHERPDGESLSLVARAYMAAVFVGAAAVTLPFIGRVPSTTNWFGFAVFATAAAVAQLFVVRTPRNQSYHTTTVFLVPAALLLPPQQLPLLVLIVQHVPEWLKHRYRWPHPDVQHRQLHARRDGGVGRRAADPALEPDRQPEPPLRGRRPHGERRPRRSSTTSCSR